MTGKVLIIGADGFLGKSLYLNISNHNSFNVIGTSRKPHSEKYLDLNEVHQINFSEYEFVIFLAGMTSIEYCEKHPELSYQTNYLSTIRLIDECIYSGCFVIFVSTNSVFSGKKKFCKVGDDTDPKSKYGEYKVAVERWIVKKHPKNIAILRLTKVVGNTGVPHFVKRWINEIKEYGSTDVYTNHFFSPITEDEVFNAMLILMNTKKEGLFQCGGLREFSYADYARDFFKNDKHSLKCLKFIKKGEGINYNSLKTFLPE